MTLEEVLKLVECYGVVCADQAPAFRAEALEDVKRALVAYKHAPDWDREWSDEVGL